MVQCDCASSPSAKEMISPSSKSQILLLFLDRRRLAWMHLKGTADDSE